MYRTIEDFKNDWTYESAATLKIIQGLTGESLNKKFNDKIRTAGKLAWHIAGAIPEMMNRTDLKIDVTIDDKEVPQTVSEIESVYKKSAGLLIEEVTQKWTDASLTEKVNMYGEDWEKGKILWVLVTHQIHHRAQLIVVMRLAGLKVHGIYGPANEEWAGMGMEPQE
jgi:uncharacterized damage-inducible protein DinB